VTAKLVVCAGRAKQVAAGAAVAVAVVSGACAPSSAMLRSHHYQLVVPAEWQATSDRGATVLHIPQAGSAPGGGKLDLRVHAWLVNRAVDQPIDESVRRLAEQGTARLQPAGDEAETTCGELPRGYRLFGEAQSAAHMRTASGDYVVVTAALTAGSLVAAVGIVPNRAPLCENLYAMTAAITSLRDRLTPADDPTLPGRPPVLLDSPVAGRPPIMLPAASPLP
jgi:hypothetical protein